MFKQGYAEKHPVWMHITLYKYILITTNKFKNLTLTDPNWT